MAVESPVKLQPGSLTIAGIALVHLYWGLVLVGHPGALHATAIFGLARIGDHRDLGVALIGVAIAALLALKQPVGQLSLACMMPQQMVLIASSAAAVRASVLQRYADGTVVPGGWAHISADQAPLVMLMLLHGSALLLFHGYLGQWME